VIVNVATNAKTFGQLHPKLARVLYTPTDREDRVAADCYCLPGKTLLTTLSGPIHWITNSIFHQIVESILYLLSFGKFKKGSLALLPTNETEQDVLKAVTIMFIEDIPQFIVQMKIYLDPNLQFLDQEITLVGLIITSIFTSAHFLICIYNIRQAHEDFGGDSIPFKKYMKYIFGIQKADDDIVTAYAQQIESGNFEGRVLNLRNGFITDEGCERLCKALRKQIDDKITNDEKSGTCLKYLYLSNNPIGDSSAENLACLLMTAGCEIYHLALGYDDMSDIGYKNIGNTLASNTTIQYLVLDHGGIYRELKDHYNDRVFEFFITAAAEKQLRGGWLLCAQQGRHTLQNA